MKPTLSINSSETCNLDCVYCYLPHTIPQANKENRKLREWLRTGEFFNQVYDLYKDSPEDLKNLALWGGEPTTNLDLFRPEIQKIIDQFPSLKRIFFSTNLTANRSKNEITKLFQEIFKREDCSTEVEVQVSIDGPAFIHNKNRLGSNIDKVVENYKHINQFVQDHGWDDRVIFKTKITLNIDNIKDLLIDDNFNEFFNFFTSLNKQGLVANAAPTLAWPGSYTVDDGKIYSKFVEKLLSRDPYIVDQIYGTFLNVMQNFNQLKSGKYSEFFQHLCSAGRDNYGLDKDGIAHWCQGTFNMNENFVEGVLEDSRDRNEFIEKLGFDHKNSGSFIQRHHYNVNNTYEMQKFNYISSAAHNNLIFMYTYNESLIDQLAIANQISDFVANNRKAKQVIAMMITHANCFTNNLSTTGDVFIGTESLIKLIANGAFEQIINHWANKD